MKTGRNEPCPCNSGKKYKRCCLEKDDQLAATKQTMWQNPIKKRNLNEELCFPNEDFIKVELTGEIEHCTSYIINGHGDILPELVKLYRENTSKEFYSIYTDCDDESPYEKELTNTFSDESTPGQSYSFEEDDLIPTISPEENTLIDEWWEKNNTLEDPTSELEHIKSFLHEHPHLDANMSLHHEVIFDLKNKFERSNEYHLFIEFLVYYREKHPNAYTLSFGYYDEYLIAYFLVQQKSNDDITPYFSLFKKYPEKFIDKFMDVVFMIISFGREDLLQNLYQDIYIPLDQSKSLLDHHSIISPYLLYQWSPFVKQLALSNNGHSEIVDALHKEQVSLNKDLKNANIRIGKKRLTRLLQECFGDLPQHPFPHPFDYIETKKYYTLIINGFTGYQIRTLLRPWVLSHNISISIFDFLMYPLEKNKIPCHPFKFSKDLINNFMNSKFKSLFSTKTYEAFSFIFGLRDFCNYLKDRELISMDDFQQLHEAASSVLGNFCELSNDYVMTYYRSLVSSNSLGKNCYDNSRI